MTQFLLIVLLFLLSSSTFATVTNAGAYLQKGIGAKAIAMGGHQTALSNDIYSPFSNPAAIAFLNGSQLSSTTSSIYGLGSEQHFGAGISDILYTSLAINYLKSGTDDIPKTTADGTDTGFRFSYDNTAYMGSLAWRFFDRIAVGGSLFYLTQDALSYSAKAYSTSFGTIISLTDIFHVGLSAFHILQRPFYWNTDNPEPEYLQKTLRAGFGLKTASLALNADVSKWVSTPLTWSLGGEYTLLNTDTFDLFIRGGYTHNGQLSFGLGSDFNGFQIDYAYLNSPNTFFDPAHHLSLNFHFRSHVPKKRPPKKASPTKQTHAQSLFSDLETHWFKNTAFNLHQLGLLDGTSVFSPETPLTRAQFAHFLVTALNLRQSYSSKTLVDVASQHPYYADIQVMIKTGILPPKRGYYHPNRSLKRVEVITAILRLNDFKGDSPNGRALPFKDIPANHWSRPILAKALSLNLIRPSQYFYPNKPMSRAQFIALLSKIPSIKFQLMDLD